MPIVCVVFALWLLGGFQSRACPVTSWAPEADVSSSGDEKSPFRTCSSFEDRLSCRYHNFCCFVQDKCLPATPIFKDCATFGRNRLACHAEREYCAWDQTKKLCRRKCPATHDPSILCSLIGHFYPTMASPAKAYLEEQQSNLMSFLSQHETMIDEAKRGVWDEPLTEYEEGDGSGKDDVNLGDGLQLASRYFTLTDRLTPTAEPTIGSPYLITPFPTTQDTSENDLTGTWDNPLQGARNICICRGPKGNKYRCPCHRKATTSPTLPTIAPTASPSQRKDCMCRIKVRRGRTKKVPCVCPKPTIKPTPAPTLVMDCECYRWAKRKKQGKRRKQWKRVAYPCVCPDTDSPETSSPIISPTISPTKTRTSSPTHIPSLAPTPVTEFPTSRGQVIPGWAPPYGLQWQGSEKDPSKTCGSFNNIMECRRQNFCCWDDDDDTCFSPAQVASNLECPTLTDQELCDDVYGQFCSWRSGSQLCVRKEPDTRSQNSNQVCAAAIEERNQLAKKQQFCFVKENNAECNMPFLVNGVEHSQCLSYQDSPPPIGKKFMPSNLPKGVPVDQLKWCGLTSNDVTTRPKYGKGWGFCTCTPKVRKRSVVLLTVDDLRPDLFAAYGRKDAQTPFLDELTHRPGTVVVDRAYTQYAVCTFGSA